MEDRPQSPYRRSPSPSYPHAEPMPLVSGEEALKGKPSKSLAVDMEGEHADADSNFSPPQIAEQQSGSIPLPERDERPPYSEASRSSVGKDDSEDNGQEDGLEPSAQVA